MITLITGTPGSGKTAFALDLMIKQKKLDDARKLYVHGIPELQVPHEIVVCDSQSCDYCSTLPIKPLLDIEEDVKAFFSPAGYLKADSWQDYAPKGAIFFFDEVQNIHRPRNSSSAVPPSVAAYEVHRHRGLDFFMITQNPSLIDGNVRALVSRHVHLSATWARRLQFEFPQCKTDLGATTGEGIKSNYTLPKDVFKLYKSASLHTKLDRKKPVVLYFIPVLIAVILALLWSFKNRVTSASDKHLNDIKIEQQIKNPVVSDSNVIPVNLKTGGGGGRAERGASPARRVTDTNANCY